MKVKHSDGKIIIEGKHYEVSKLRVLIGYWLEANPDDELAMEMLHELNNPKVN